MLVTTQFSRAPDKFKVTEVYEPNKIFSSTWKQERGRKKEPVP